MKTIESVVILCQHRSLLFVAVYDKMLIEKVHPRLWHQVAIVNHAIYSFISLYTVYFVFFTHMFDNSKRVVKYRFFFL